MQTGEPLSVRPRYKVGATGTDFFPVVLQVENPGYLLNAFIRKASGNEHAYMQAIRVPLHDFRRPYVAAYEPMACSVTV